MTGEQTVQLRNLIRKSPPKIWGYLPFIFPVLMVILGVAANIALVIYFQKKAPDLQVLFKHGSNIEPVWDSEMIQKVVLITVLAITTTFVLLAFLALASYHRDGFGGAGYGAQAAGRAALAARFIALEHVQAPKNGRERTRFFRVANGDLLFGSSPKKVLHCDGQALENRRKVGPLGERHRLLF